MRALLVVASVTAFACGDSDTSNLDAGGEELDARISDAAVGAPDAPTEVPDAPTGVPDAPVAVPDAPTEVPDAPTGVPDAPVAVPDAPLLEFDAPIGDVDAPPGDEPDAPPPLPIYDASLLPDAFVTDAFDVKDAGLTQTRTFRFLMDSETLFQSFADPGTAMTWRGDDGDPPGSLSFTATAEGTVKVVSPAFSWETWGVPPGALVVYIRMVGYKHRLVTNSGMGHSWAFEIVGADNKTAHEGENGAYLEFNSLSNVPSATWESVTDLPIYEVRAPYRVSNSELYVKVWYFPLLAGEIEWRLDEIELEITYVLP